MTNFDAEVELLELFYQLFLKSPHPEIRIVILASVGEMADSFSGGGTAVAGAVEEQKMIVFGVSYSTTKEAFRAYFAQVTALC